MDLKKIEIILRALELKSLAKAAEEYNYTPSALSHMTDSVEEELGIKLVKRGYSGIEPEENAEKIIELLTELIRIRGEIFREISNSKKDDNSLTVGTYASLSRHILPGITKSFREKHPDINVNITVVNDVVPLMESGEAEVIIAEEPELPGWEWKVLAEDSYFAVFPQSYGGTEKKFSPDKKYDFTFILAQHRITEEYINLENYKDVIKVRSDDDGTVIDMVAAGAGIAILPGLSLKGAEDRVKIMELDPPLKRTLGLAYKKENATLPSVARFVEHLSVTEGLFSEI